MKVIGIAGVAHAGKSTAAHAIARHLVDLGFNPQVRQFAAALKDASNRLGFLKGGKYDHLYREFCQWVGNRAREEDPNYWVKLVETELAYLAEQELEPEDFHETVVIFDDLRYPNELDMIRRYRGHTIFVSAIDRLGPDEMMKEFRRHASEDMATLYEHGGLDDEMFDLTISNNSRVKQADFEKAVAELGQVLVESVREESR